MRCVNMLQKHLKDARRFVQQSRPSHSDQLLKHEKSQRIEAKTSLAQE